MTSPAGGDGDHGASGERHTALRCTSGLDGQGRPSSGPVYTLADLIFVPAGVLAAGVLQHRGAGVTFGLFAALMLKLFVLSFNGFGSALCTADAASDTLAVLPDRPASLRGARRVDELGERTSSRCAAAALR